MKDICESAVKRGGADMNADTMERASKLMLKEMTYRLCDGFAANLGWFYVQPAIKGIFNSPKETFNPKKQKLTIDVVIGALLRKELGNTEIEIQGVADVSIYIAEVHDMESGTVNELLTPGQILKIFGSKLRIAGENEANGVYFVNSETQERTKVPLAKLAFNDPSMLGFNVPALAPGSYKIEITTQFSSGKESKQLLKEPRTTVFERILTVLEQGATP